MREGGKNFLVPQKIIQSRNSLVVHGTCKTTGHAPNFAEVVSGYLVDYGREPLLASISMLVGERTAGPCDVDLNPATCEGVNGS